VILIKLFNIFADINELKPKNIDIDAIKIDDKLAFFKIQEEDTDKLSKIIKESAIIENLNNEILSNLNAETLNLNNEVVHPSKKTKFDFDMHKISRENIIKSYEMYNNALSLSKEHYITSAFKLIEKAYDLNKNDVDILNLRGMLSLLRCEFSKALSSFQMSLVYEEYKEHQEYTEDREQEEYIKDEENIKQEEYIKDEGNIKQEEYIKDKEVYRYDKISDKYIEILKTDEFELFMGRYNHAIRFIYDGMYYESAEILSNLSEEQPELINILVLLSFVYQKINKNKKLIQVLSHLRELDKDNEMIEKNNNTNNVSGKIIEKETCSESKNATKNKSSKVPENKKTTTIIVSLVAVLAVVFIINQSVKKTNNKNLNQETTQNIQSELDNKDADSNNKKEEAKDDLNKQEEVKNEETKNKEELPAFKNEEAAYENAIASKKVEDIDTAIKYYKLIVQNGKSKKLISESIYQLAVLNSKEKNIDESIKYYKKYINTYTKSETYYDDCYYELGMLYYNNGKLEEAQQVFYDLKSEVPDSMYNNSKINEILKER
jgi:TolA-binding protein